jgi:hypothetical protein
MIILIIIVFWSILGFYYTGTDMFEGVNFDDITPKGIFDLISILPIFIVLYSILYVTSLIGIGFNYYELCDDMVDVTYITLPRYFKKKWLIHISKEDNPRLHGCMKSTPAKLQEYIVQHYISNNFYFSQDDFKLLKTDLLKWNYINWKKELNSWEKDWLVEFTARERERKINQILAD